MKSQRQAIVSPSAGTLILNTASARAPVTLGVLALFRHDTAAFDGLQPSHDFRPRQRGKLHRRASGGRDPCFAQAAPDVRHLQSARHIFLQLVGDSKRRQPERLTGHHDTALKNGYRDPESLCSDPDAAVLRVTRLFAKVLDENRLFIPGNDRARACPPVFVNAIY